MSDRREIERRERSRNKKSVLFDNHKEFDTSSIIRKFTGSQEPVIVYVRRSIGNKSDNEQMKESGRKWLESKGIQIKEDKYGSPCVFGEVESGKPSRLDQRKELKRAVKETENGKYPLLVITPSRLLRSEQYHPCWNPNIKPNEEEWRFLVTSMGMENIQLYSVSNPNLSIDEDEAFLNKVMVVDKPKRRGYSKSRRSKWCEYAVELISSGYSIRNTARVISEESGYRTGEATIRRWLKRDSSLCSK